MCYGILIIFLVGPNGTKLKILIDHFIPKISVQKQKQLRRMAVIRDSTVAHTHTLSLHCNHYISLKISPMSMTIYVFNK